ncbi:nitrogen regulation protein NR(II) [Thermodesulfobacteriota bacterium]
MILVPKDILMETLRDPAAIISSNGSIIQTNSYLSEGSATVENRPCYEGLAGSVRKCPFCPFDDLMAGRVKSVVGAVQVRWGTVYTVDVHALTQDDGSVLLLETMRQPGPEELSHYLESSWDGELSDLLKKHVGLFLTGRELMGSAPDEDKLTGALRQIRIPLDNPTQAKLWIELDGQTFGEPCIFSKCVPWAVEIIVEGQTRGRLCLAYPDAIEPSSVETEFLGEAADLIARATQMFDYECSLREARKRSERLISNLKKEMWRRTEALSSKTTYLEGILRSSEDIIITTDLESRIVEFNPGAEKFLGYSAEELHGRPITEIWENAEERARILEDVTSKGGIRNYETRLKTKCGVPIDISLTLSLLKDNEGRILGTVGLSKDITDEKAIVTQLELLNQNYRETLHFINHEFKNSLLVIGGFVNRLLLSEEDPRRKEELRIIYHHSKFLEAMSLDFLVMAELEHGNIQVRKRLIGNLYEEVILPAMMGLKERYPDSFESYDTTMGGIGDVQLMGDPNLLEIVYRNLFGNALKYRHAQGKIAFGVEKREDGYLLNVWNSGPGVGPDQIDKVFDKFYRAQDETTRRKRGTGLGLYNIRRIIEAHGGRIWCESRPGKWVNFLFTLPKE